MGVAEECEEVEEYSQQIEQMKRQDSSLTEVISKTKTEKTETDCYSEDCTRPIDWYCRFCKGFICTRCSKKPCKKQDHHDVYDFEEIYETCKYKYQDWKGGKKSVMGTLTKQQKKLQDEIAVEIQKMATASPEELMKPEMAKVVSELPAKRKLLEDITKKVEEAGNSLSTYGGDIESLSQQEFIKVFAEFDLSSSLFELKDLSKVSVSANCTVVSKRTCYDIDITPAGELLLAGNRAFHICSKGGEVLRTVPNEEGDYTSIQYYKGRIYTLLKEPKGSSKRRIIVFDAAGCREVRRWELPPYAYVSMMAVSNDKVYVSDSDSKKVKIYSLNGELKPDFFHAAFRNPVYMSSCAPDGVLLADWSAGIVYKIQCRTDKIAWQFNIKNPRGVYCDKMGIVWVWSSEDKALYVRSSDGQQMRRYDHQKLLDEGVEYICGMIMDEDKLYVATCGKGVVSIQVYVE